jgi:uncharacterized protein (DUF1684 family)
MSTAYENHILKLREEDGQKSAENPLDWLNLAGLFWLEEGENSFGSDENNKIALPTFPAAVCGSFHLQNNVVTFHPAKDVPFTSKRPNPESRPLVTDRDREADLISIGRLTMKIIVRGPATLVRIWDREAPAKIGFTGFKYFPVDETYVVEAKYVRYDPPKIVKRVDVIGTETEGQFLGEAHFKLHGVDCTLVAEKDGETLLFHFTDETSKTSTYGGGRKFNTPLPKDDKITLDFNLTENWPCAYTPFATCPLVPSENRLSVKIEAGEKKYFEY